jgi:hypothetical protein
MFVEHYRHILIYPQVFSNNLKAHFTMTLKTAELFMIIVKYESIQIIHNPILVVPRAVLLFTGEVISDCIITFQLILLLIRLCLR